MRNKTIIKPPPAVERELKDFPDSIRAKIAADLQRLQLGGDPLSWKPLKTIGPGVCEIRVRDASGAYRVVYVATRSDGIHILHAFQKQSAATPKQAIALCRKRLAALPPE